MGLAVHSKGKVVSVTPVIDTSAYASGDQLGAITEVPNAVEESSGSAILSSLTVVDASAQSGIIQVLFFRDKPAIASSDNGALNITDAEMLKCVGVVSFVAADYFATSANSVASAKNINLVLNATRSADNPTGKSIWVIMRSGGAYTYAALGLNLKLGLVQA